MAKAGEGATASLEIVWNAKEGKFETVDKEAFLQYHLREVVIGDGHGGGEAKKKTKMVMDMVHTYVPRSKRGMGLAALLCDAAFTHAQGQSLPVIPTCSYISDTYLPRNPSWNSLVYVEEPKSNM